MKSNKVIVKYKQVIKKINTKYLCPSCHYCYSNSLHNKQQQTLMSCRKTREQYITSIIVTRSSRKRWSVYNGYVLGSLFTST